MYRAFALFVFSVWCQSAAWWWLRAANSNNNNNFLNVNSNGNWNNNNANNTSGGVAPDFRYSGTSDKDAVLINALVLLL